MSAYGAAPPAAYGAPTPSYGARGGGGGAGGNGGGRRRRRRDLFRPDSPFGAAVNRAMSQYQEQADITNARATEDLQGLYSENFDPNSPFSRQALLQRSLDQARNETYASRAAAGHLYSGGTAAAAGNVEFQGQQAQDQLLRDYGAQASDIGRRRDDALSGISQQADSALMQAVMARIQNTDSTPGARFRRGGRGGRGRR